MAEASSAALATAAAQLREAAKQTMRRKQAPPSRPAVPAPRNGTAASSLAQSSSMGSSLPPPPIRVPPRGPRGVASLSATNATPLNYGDPNDSPTMDVLTASGSTRQPEQAREQQPRRMLSRARAAAAQREQEQDAGMSREEGEISDEDIRTRRLQQDERSSPESPPSAPLSDPVSVDTPNPAPVTANSSTSVLPGPTESTNDVDASTKGAVVKLCQMRPTATKSVPLTASTPPPKRSNTFGGMQPPPPPTNVHREPGPISPSLSIPNTKAQPSIRSLHTDTLLVENSSQPRVKPSLPPPSLQTHSFESLARTRNYLIEINGDEDEDDGMEGLSPKTRHLNQEVFTQLLNLGVDEHHCRPNLPSKPLLATNYACLTTCYSDIPTI